jgi:Na+-driven multidrug efflux pump
MHIHDFTFQDGYVRSQEECEHEDEKTRIRNILKLAIPTLNSNLFKRFNNTLILMVVGSINPGDPSVMAGIGLGNMTKLLLGSTILQGCNGSIETYVSQAAGAGEHKMAGIYLNQGRLILLLCFIPICIMLS